MTIGVAERTREWLSFDPGADDELVSEKSVLESIAGYCLAFALTADNLFTSDGRGRCNK